MRSLELRIVPDAVLIAVGGLMWLTSKVSPSVEVALPFRSVVASVLVITAVILVVSAHVALMRAETTAGPRSPERARRLVTVGVFSRTRNPMYLAMLLILVAFAALLANPFSLALTALFVAYISRFQIEPEERALRARFGETYDDYSDRVRRWV